VRPPLRAALWLAALGLLLVPLPERGAARRDAPVLVRLLGPIATVAASAQWVRVDLAIRAGREGLALARARTALALDPGASEGWIFLTRHLALELASPTRESDPEVRAAWLRAADELARLGEEHAREPGELALWRGLFLYTAATLDPDTRWPGGRRALLGEAERAFARAEELGVAAAAGFRRAAAEEGES